MATSSNDVQQKLETIDIGGHAFLIDHDKQELRKRSNASDRITFDHLKKNKTEDGFSIVFCRIKQALYEGPMEPGVLPPATDRVVLPTSVLLDRRREQNQNQEQKPKPEQERDMTKQWKQGQWNRPETQPQKKVKKRRSISR